VETIAQALQQAVQLIANFDAVLFGIVLLSLRVSLSAVGIATAIGLPPWCAFPGGRQ
jgi:ABC-type tungstate transport system substrate-binding protein